MGIFAAIIGALGGLSAVAGILNAAEVLPNDIGFMTVTWTFWFALAAVLLLASVAISVSNRDSVE
jgi:hypothetical protein